MTRLARRLFRLMEKHGVYRRNGSNDEEATAFRMMDRVLGDKITVAKVSEECLIRIGQAFSTFRTKVREALEKEGHSISPLETDEWMISRVARFARMAGRSGRSRR